MAIYVTSDLHRLARSKFRRLLAQEKLDWLNNYALNSGGVTLKSLRKLRRTAPEIVTKFSDYLKEAPLYETACVNNRDFLLVHAGLEHFTPEPKISDYTLDDFLWAWPEHTDQYYEHVTTVFGHTPVMTFGAQ